MTTCQAVLLGLIQGVTEFLPVSSSGHLALAQIFMGWQMPSLAYDLTLHLATLLAVVLYFWRDLIEILVEWTYALFHAPARRWRGWKTGWTILLATAITAVIAIPLKPLVETAFQNSLWVGCGLLATAAIMLLSRFVPEGAREIGFFQGLIAGLAQGFAAMPGVSRSGTTLFAGMLGGLRKEDAFRLSFLLSIPAILGAFLLEARHLGGLDEFSATLPTGWYWGALVAFASGLVSLVVLKRLVVGSKSWLFGFYCLVLGGTVVAVTLGGGW